MQKVVGMVGVTVSERHKADTHGRDVTQAQRLLHARLRNGAEAETEKLSLYMVL